MAEFQYVHNNFIIVILCDLCNVFILFYLVDVSESFCSSLKLSEPLKQHPLFPHIFRVTWICPNRKSQLRVNSEDYIADNKNLRLDSSRLFTEVASKYLKMPEAKWK